MRELEPGSIEELAAGITPEKALPSLLFSLADNEAGDKQASVASLVKTRANGFMVAVSQSEVVREALETAALESGETFLFHDGHVSLLGSRGKVLGDIDVTLVDLPWSCSGLFIKQATLRGAGLRRATIHAFEFAGGKGRLHPGHTLDLADEWVTANMEEDTAQEYATAAELDGAPLSAQDEVGSQQGGAADLQARIAELEQELRLAKEQASPAMPPPMPQNFGRTQGLFQPQRMTSVAAADMAKLQALAGSPPPRTGKHEQRRVVWLLYLQALVLWTACWRRPRRVSQRI